MTHGLSAGPVAARADGAQLHGVSVGGRELVRRIALVVRDEHWGTLPLRVDVAALDEDGTGIDVRGTARREGLELAWRVRFTVDSGGIVTAESVLRALRPGLTNRAGLVVLLDPGLARGASGRWQHAGRTGVARLPELVGPQWLRGGLPCPLVGPFEHLELRLSDGSALRVSFPDDAFELEDERNWTDGSFKLYGPPLALGFPRELREDEVTRQRVRLEMAPPRRKTMVRPPRPTVVRVGPRVGAVPALGTLLQGAGSPAPTPALRQIGLTHVRADASVAGPAERLHERLRAIGAPVELGLHLGAALPDADAVAELLAALQPVRVLVHGDAPCTPQELLDTVSAAAARVGVNCHVVGGTDGHFADLNRERPLAEAWDGLVIPMSPQVHGRDDATIRGALIGMPAAIATARVHLRPRRICVSPLAMTPRSGPGSAPHDSTLEEARERMARPATAAWLLAAVGCLGAAGGLVSSVTAFADAGPDGVFDDRTGAPLPAAVLLAALAPVAGHGLLALDGLPDGVEGFATEQPDGAPTAWLANVGGRAVHVPVVGAVGGLAGEHDLGARGPTLDAGAVVTVALADAASRLAAASLGAPGSTSAVVDPSGGPL